MLHGFTRVTLVIMGPLLAWLACFTAIYVTGAVACARGFAGVRVAGLGVVGLITAVLVLATAAFTLWKLAAAMRHYRSSRHNDSFTGFMALGAGGLALLGLLLLSLPALILRPPCAGQPVLELGTAASAEPMPAQSYSPRP